MPRFASILAILIAAFVAGWLVPLGWLYDGLPSLTVSLSIMLAAVFVRLNRGMPTLDWKSLEQIERIRITDSIVKINKEYVIVVCVLATTLFLLISVTTIGRTNATVMFSLFSQQILAAIIVGLVGLCIFRMGYIVWRDYDIVKLQKILIDKSGEKDNLELEVKSATEKIVSMQSANLRKEPRPNPKIWDNKT